MRLRGLQSLRGSIKQIGSSLRRMRFRSRQWCCATLQRARDSRDPRTMVSARVSARCRQRGLGLIEVLISVLILAVGLLGVAAMQTTALRMSQAAFERGQVVIQSYSILETMRANREAALAGAYNQGSDGMICAVPIAANNLATADLQRWITALKQAIGRPDDKTTCGRVRCNAAGECTVTVQWDDSRASQAASANGRVGAVQRQEQTITVL